MTSTKPVCALCALAILSACGGSGGGVVGPISPDPLTFSQIVDLAEDVNIGYNAVDITPKNDVPIGGAARFSGPVGGDLTVGRRVTDVAGVMYLDVDFGRDRVSGRVGNLVTRAGDPISGALSVRDGSLNRTSNSQQVAIFADVDGTLRSAAGERIDVDARLRNSGFKGRDVRFVGGDIEGDIWVDGQRGEIDLDLQLER